MIKKLFTLLALPLLLCAQDGSFEIYGYSKYLFSSTKDAVTDNRLNDHLIHSRLNSRWYVSQNLTGAMELRLRAFYGNSLDKMPGYKDQLKNDYEYAKLDAEFWSKKRTLGYAEIDRLYFDYTRNDFQVTAGRQRIAWGTSLVWNIIDLFNPMSVLDFDYEEKPGTDALRFQYYTGAVSKAELVYKPGKTKYSQTIAGSWSMNALAYDFFIILALQNNRRILAGAWSGDIKGAGFRGELKFSEAAVKGKTTQYPLPPEAGKAFSASANDEFSFVLSADYTFSSTFYIHSEVLYNNNGKEDNSGFFWQQANEAGMLSPARWSLYQEFAYDITPLLRGSAFGIYNPLDHSTILVPSLNWSVLTNLDLMALAFVTTGEKTSEFGAYGNSLFLRLKYAF